MVPQLQETFEIIILIKQGLNEQNFFVIDQMIQVDNF